MVVDREIRVMPIMLGAGLVTTRYCVIEEGRIIDACLTLEAARVSSDQRAEMWEDHEW